MAGHVRWRRPSAAWLALGTGFAVAVLSFAVPSVALWRHQIPVVEIELGRGLAGFQVTAVGSEPDLADAEYSSYGPEPQPPNHYWIADHDVTLKAANVAAKLSAGDSVYIQVEVSSYADGNDGLRYSWKLTKQPTPGGTIASSKISVWEMEQGELCDENFDPDPDRTPFYGPIRTSDPDAFSPPPTHRAIPAEKDQSTMGDRWCLVLDRVPDVYQNDVIVTFTNDQATGRSRWGMLWGGAGPWHVCVPPPEGDDEDVVVTISPELYRGGP